MKRSNTASLPIAAPRAPGGDIAKARILILDDHEFVRRGLAAMINAEPDMAVCGSGGVVSFDVAALRALRPDVVLLDVSGSQRVALSLVQGIRRVDSQVRIVALAMFNRPASARPLLTAGASDYVFKADVAERVLAAVRRASGPGRVHDRPPLAAGRAVALQRRRGAIARQAGEFDEVEREIIAMVGAGVPTPAIAARLRIPLRTVQAGLRRIKAKIHVASATALVRYCVEWQRRSRRIATA